MNNLVKSDAALLAHPDRNRLAADDRAVHDWYRFILSFPPHLVREYILRFGIRSGQYVLDPFCGTGTTLVECKKLGISYYGVEANPLACFASRTKVKWDIAPQGLLDHATEVARTAVATLDADGVPDETLPLLQSQSHHANGRLRTLPPAQAALLLTNSISPRPLHKTLVLLEHIARHGDTRYGDHERLALAKAAVLYASNLEFGPEVGVGELKEDATVVAPWLDTVRQMAADMQGLQDRTAVPGQVFQADSRHLDDLLPAQSVHAVITSPPYPNEKDYTRTTRLESVLLGFVKDKAELCLFKQGLLRSNTRGVYRADDDDRWIAEFPDIQQIADAIEARRLELGKTSGFERMYARVTRLYFGGMYRHLANLRRVLYPGAQLAYVVGDQASYLRVMIRTGEFTAQIAASLGYQVESIDLFRTRIATATREQLREEVVVLRWPG